MRWLQHSVGADEAVVIGEEDARQYRRLAVRVWLLVLSVVAAILVAQRWLLGDAWFDLALSSHATELVMPSLSVFVVGIVLTQPPRRALALCAILYVVAVAMMSTLPANSAAVALRYWTGSVMLAGVLMVIIWPSSDTVVTRLCRLFACLGLFSIAIPMVYMAMEFVWPTNANVFTNSLCMILGVGLIWASKRRSMSWASRLYALLLLLQLPSVLLVGEQALPLLGVYLLASYVLLAPRVFLVFATFWVSVVLLLASGVWGELENIRAMVFAVSQLMVWICFGLLLPLWSGAQGIDEASWSKIFQRRSLKWQFAKVWLGLLVVIGLMLWPLVFILNRQGVYFLHSSPGAFFILLGLFILTWLAWLVVQSGIREQMHVVLTQHANDSALAKGRFLSTLSHEMRTPLNGILGLLQVLESDHEMRRAQGGNLQLLRFSGEQLHRVVEDVIDISRAEQGKLVLHVGSTDLASMVSRIYLFLNQEAKLKGIILHVSTRLPKSVTAEIDEARCIQVIESIGSSVLHRCQHGDRVELIFSLGIDGISVLFASPYSQEVLAEIPFGVETERLSTDTITVKVMHLLGVSLSLHAPRASQQQAILLEIPMVVDVPMHEPEKPPVYEAMPRPRVESGKLKILIVDDENSNLMVMKLALEKHYANIEQADGGQNALDQMALQAFDLVISDISMPGMSGEQLLQHMRAMGIETPVIALTGNLSDDDNRRFLSEGFERVLHKPVDLAKLRQTVAEILSA